MTSPIKYAAIFIECQNEWLNSQGFLRNHLINNHSLIDKASAQALKLLNIARLNSLTIIHAPMAPDSGYSLFGEARYGLRAIIPNVGTWKGAMQDFHPNFTPLEPELVIQQRAGASAFSGSCLDSFLRNNRINDILLCGFATHVCVESTLRDAHDRGYNTGVVTDACAAFTENQQHYFESSILEHFGYATSVKKIAHEMNTLKGEVEAQ